MSPNLLKDSRTLRLLCLIEGEDRRRIFPVSVSTDDNVYSLHEAIQRATGKPIAARDLDLFQVWVDIPSQTDDYLRQLTFTGNEDEVRRLEPWRTIDDFWCMQPDRNEISVVVRFPHAVSPSPYTSKRKLSEEGYTGSHKRPMISTGTSTIETWRSIHPKSRLPLLSELRCTIDRPFLESEKMPIENYVYDAFLSSDPVDLCTKNDIDTLFTSTDGNHPDNLFEILAMVRKPPPASGTDKLFISFWDKNIRSVLELMLPTGKTVRYDNTHPPTQNLRPDFGFLLGNVCPFCGEEMGSDDPEDQGLANKFNWIYDPAPYMLGYYCKETVMTLVAICKPVSPGSKPVVSDILRLDLRLRKDRIKNIRYLINLSGVIKNLAELFTTPINDFRRFKGDESTVEITSTLIVKTYICENGKAKVEHLKRVYAILERQGVPNTDMLVYSDEDIAHLSPRGISGKPKSEKELVQCLVCIIQLLVAAHDVPIFHRDIRWPNIIRRLDDDSKWFLIDWEHAATPPTKAQRTFSGSSHSPAIFIDHHGEEVDIWGVGHLIAWCNISDISQELKALGTDILRSSQLLSARDILDSLNEHARKYQSA